MKAEEYEIMSNDNHSYTFISDGKNGKIIKAVIFQDIKPSLYNLALLNYNEQNDE